MRLDGFRDSIKNGHGFRSRMSDVKLRQLFMKIVNKNVTAHRSPGYQLWIEAAYPDNIYRFPPSLYPLFHEPKAIYVEARQ